VPSLFVKFLVAVADKFDMLKRKDPNDPETIIEDLQDYIRNLESRLINLENVIAAIDPSTLPPEALSAHNQVRQIVQQGQKR